MGVFSTPVERRPADQTPRVSSGAFGGRMIDFRRFAARGVVLLGRAESAHDGVMVFSNDLVANIAQGDAGYSRLTGMIDTYISDNGLDVPEDVIHRPYCLIPCA